MWKIGSQLSAEAGAIYQSRDFVTQKYIEKGFNFTASAAIVVHIAPTLLLISYIIFGYPSSDIWFTPISIEKA